MSVRIRRAVTAAGPVAGIVAAVAGVPGRALAGDPGRYADRASWPQWVAVARDEDRLYPEEGELVDAIRFELIRGYPVKATDPLEYEDREFRFYQAMTRAEFAAALSRSCPGAGWAPCPVVPAPRGCFETAGIIPAGSSTN